MGWFQKWMYTWWYVYTVIVPTQRENLSQSSHSPRQVHFILIYHHCHMSFLFLSFAASLHLYHKAAWHSSLFYFSRMNDEFIKKKKASRTEQARRRLLWSAFGARPLLPKRCNGEPRSAHSDTVKPSGIADYGAKYWSPPHMCQNSPHPLIRISPPCHTGTNRIY